MSETSAMDKFVRQQLSERKWMQERSVDDVMREGIIKGLPFAGFKQLYGAPEHLRQRYNNLIEQTKAEEARRPENDVFIKAWNAASLEPYNEV
jgi:hypothetical protein